MCEEAFRDSWDQWDVLILVSEASQFLAAVNAASRLLR